MAEYPPISVIILHCDLVGPQSIFVLIRRSHQFRVKLAEHDREECLGKVNGNALEMKFLHLKTCSFCKLTVYENYRHSYIILCQIIWDIYCPPSVLNCKT